MTRAVCPTRGATGACIDDGEWSAINSIKVWKYGPACCGDELPLPDVTPCSIGICLGGQCRNLPPPPPPTPTRLLMIGGADSGRVYTYPDVGSHHVAQEAWSELEALPRPTCGAMGAQVGTKVYAIGGFGFDPTQYDAAQDPVSQVDVLDILTNTWESGPELPSPRAAGKAVLVGTEIWVLGGVSTGEKGYNPVWVTTDLDSVVILDTITGTWREGPTMPQARAWFGAAVVGTEKIFVMDHLGVDVLDLNTLTWSEGPPMPSPRTSLQAVAMGTDIYALFGTSERVGEAGGVIHSRIDILDTTTMTWREGPSTDDATFQEGANFIFMYGAAAVDEKIYIMGGAKSAVAERDATGTWVFLPISPVFPTQGQRNVLVLDTATGEWRMGNVNGYGAPAVDDLSVPGSIGLAMPSSDTARGRYDVLLVPVVDP